MPNSSWATAAARPNSSSWQAAAPKARTASLPGLPLDKMPGGKAFADKFDAKYGQIQLYAPYCYDAVNVHDRRHAEGRLRRAGEVPAGAGRHDP